MDYSFDAIDYKLYFESDFRHRWLRPHQLYEKLEKFNTPFAKEQIGSSIEGRPIYSLQYGHGVKKVLLWSQIHGNEPTATMAIIDLLNFFSSSDHYDPLRKYLNEHLSISIIPMLNPDGAERFSRRNTLNIDLNRDAHAQKMPELRLLIQQVQNLKPHWTFNLHDQRNIFSAGNTDQCATISFLAPSANEARTPFPVREKSMKLIGELADIVDEILPGHLAKYTDEFYPRALGEYLHIQETPCVLIESGAFPDDHFRDQARKLNFLCLLKAFVLIASEDYENCDISKYDSIPDNHTNMLDLILRDCELNFKDQTFEADLGFLYKEIPDLKTGILQKILILQDIGDLSFHHGLQELKGGKVLLGENSLQLEQVADFIVYRMDGDDLIFEKGHLIPKT